MNELIATAKGITCEIWVEHENDNRQCNMPSTAILIVERPRYLEYGFYDIHSGTPEHDAIVAYGRGHWKPIPVEN